MALTLAGDFAESDAVARESLSVASRQTMSRADIDQVLDGFAEVPTFPDAEPALRRLVEAGIRVAA